MRFWDDKDGSGKPLTDGRVCLVIRSDDPHMPEIRTYGRDKEEVLEKLAKTTETAQSEIHRLRSKPAPPLQPTAAPAIRVTADEQARATADLSDPSKSPQALQTLLRAGGVPIDQMKLQEDAKRIADVAQAWERNNPDFPHEDRNQRNLINTAALRFGFENITAAALDAAYQELVQHGMLFDPAPPPEEVRPDGSRVPRTAVRNATSYRSNALRTPTPVSHEKPKYTRAQIDALNSRQLREKIEQEPGFSDWYNREFAAKSA